MSFPITHAIVADQVRRQYFPGLEPQPYFLGTVFPDIRYLGELSRQQTHPDPITSLARIKQLSPFQIGIQVHLLLDDKRDGFLQNREVYRDFGQFDKGAINALKHFEAEYSAQQMPERSHIAQYFNGAIREELDQGGSAEKVELWHKLVRQYIERPFSVQSGLQFARQLGIKEEVLQSQMSWMDKISHMPDVLQAVNDFISTAPQRLFE